MKSKIGLTLVGIYALVIGLAIWAEVGCQGYACGYAIGFTTFPWPLIFGGLGGYFQVGFYILLNFILLYLIGLGVTKVIKR